MTDTAGELHSHGFDPIGPLPTGTTVLEASAGTGKTYAIEALAVRYVAEGVTSLDRLLVVTFGRNATAELRERVRARFVVVHRGLHSAAPDMVAPGQMTDPLIGHLGGADRDLHRERLGAGLSTFDASTIETTHGFCNQMLRGLGLGADADLTPELTDDSDDLLQEVLTDLYLSEYGRRDSPSPSVALAKVLAPARAALAHPDAAVIATQQDPAALERVRLALAARVGVGERKRERQLRDYDDMLTSLRDALVAPDSGEAACARLRDRYRVVLVDEFQDTDPVQWQILRTAFHGHSTMILVGDPKQAIYAFRGGDVATYRSATREADTTYGLDVNRRSDAAVVAGVQHILGGAQLGEGITVAPVRAAQQTARLVGAPVAAAVRIRAIARPRSDMTTMPAVATLRAQVAVDVATDLVSLLAGTATYTDGATSRPITAADVAVLVRTNEQGSLVRNALVTAGVPVTLSGAASVFASEAAADWWVLLQAIAAPHRSRRVARAALTVFVGWSAQRLAISAHDQLDRLTDTVRQWGRVLEASGVAALLEAATTATDLPARVLGVDGGERVLTDIRHVAQALHAASTEGHRGVAALTTWLGSRITEATADRSEDRSQRLDSDAHAVPVLTIHRSKGSQYPVVYAPYLWDRYVPATPDIVRWHDDAGSRVIGVARPASFGGRDGPAGPDYAEALRRHQAEESGEDLRLLYVALTRAASHVVTWWAPGRTTPGSPLHRLVFGGRSGGDVPTEVPVASDAESHAVLRAVAEASAGTVAFEIVEPAAVDAVPNRLPVATADPAGLTVRAFSRGIDSTWRRTSYSRLTSAAHDAAYGHVPSDAISSADVGSPDGPAVTNEPETGRLDDESVDGVDPVLPDAPQIPDDPAEPLRSVLSPMSHLPVGAAFGTVVHAILEAVDPASPDLVSDLTRHALALRGPVSIRDAQLVGPALVPSLQTPLGVLAHGRRLVDIGARDRLSEMEFELPLGGGGISQIAQVLREELAADDPLRDYATDLDGLARHDDPSGQGRHLRGYLTGSMDAVLRVRDAQGEPSYVVVDYKTNWLGPGRNEDLTAWHYRPDALVAAMRSAHYPLQALLYSVALHRFLRWRQPDYEPSRHLGGCLYLFLRGMVGPQSVPVGADHPGVFSWQPGAAVVLALSDLLDGRRP